MDIYRCVFNGRLQTAAELSVRRYQRPRLAVTFTGREDKAMSNNVNSGYNNGAGKPQSGGGGKPQAQSGSAQVRNEVQVKVNKTLSNSK